MVGQCPRVSEFNSGLNGFNVDWLTWPRMMIKYLESLASIVCRVNVWRGGGGKLDVGSCRLIFLS